MSNYYTLKKVELPTKRQIEEKRALLASYVMVIMPSELPNLIRYREYFSAEELPEIINSVTERILKSC